MEQEVKEGQGRIHVSDSAAFEALLREETIERSDPPPGMADSHQHYLHPPVRRVYVDSPVSMDGDDDKYHFVSTDVEDSHDYSEENTPKHVGFIADDPASGRYEDRSTHREDPQLGSNPAPVAQPQVQYVVKSKPDTSHSTKSDHQTGNNAQFVLHPDDPYTAHHTEPRIIEPIKSPLLPSSKSDLDERRALRQEAVYQQQLEEKLRQQSHETEQIHIPRLALERLEDEERLPRALHPLHDSLEDEYLVGDSLEERQAQALIRAASGQAAGQHGGPSYEATGQYGGPSYQAAGQHGGPSYQPAGQHRGPSYQPAGQHGGPSFQAAGQDVGPSYQAAPQYHGMIQDSLDVGHHQFARDSLDDAGYQGHPQQEEPRFYDPNQPAERPEYYQPQGYDTQNSGPPAHGYHGYPDPQYGQESGYREIPGEEQSDPQHYHHGYPQRSGYHEAPQGYPDIGSEYQMPQDPHSVVQPDTSTYHDHQHPSGRNVSDNGQFSGEIPSQNFPSHSEHYYSQASDNLPLPEKPPSDNFLNSQPPIIRDVKPPLKPKHDFLSLNKQTLGQSAPRKKTYGQLHNTKKTSKENITPSSPTNPGKTSGKSNPGKIPRSGPSDSTMDTGQFSAEQLSAEQLWAKRSERLENKKQLKLSGKQGSRDLRKFSSESRVDAIRDSATSTKSSPAGPYHAHRTPHHVHPIQQTPPLYKSLAEPIRSEVVSVSNTTPSQPIKHTIVTEDGQRLSVDINLKVISPTPHRGPPAPPTEWQQHPEAFRPHIPVTGHQGAAPGYSIPVNNYMGTDPYDDQGYPSPQDVATPKTSASSAYRVLPPIGTADSEQSLRDEPPPRTVVFGHSSPHAAGQGMGGYAAQYIQQKTKKSDYKEYTLEDYRKLKKEIRLGGLGPEINNETTREKREKRLRQIEYAKSLKSRPPVAGVKPSSSTPLHDLNSDDDDVMHKRKVALEYARSVPKPKVRSKPRASSQPASDRQSSNHSHRDNELEVIDLKKLQERHELERQQVALIRRNVENLA